MLAIKVEEKDAQELWEFLQENNINGTWKNKKSFFKEFSNYPYWNFTSHKFINRGLFKFDKHILTTHSLFFKNYKFTKYIWI